MPPGKRSTRPDAAPPRRRGKWLARLADENLAAAVELNAGHRLRLLGRLPWVEFTDDGDALRIFSGDTWPGNCVALARFAPDAAPRRIGEILERALEHKVACDWIVGPVSQPADLGRHLRAHGFKCMVHCAGMACDLATISPKSSPPDGVTITMTDDPPLLDPPTTDRRRRRYEGRHAMARMKPRQVWHFAATLDGKAVGETTICLGAGVAGIYTVVVKEKFRGRGIGTALVHAALLAARELPGCRAAVLSATGMGFSIYSRLGFRKVCKLSFWKYGKMRQQAPLAKILRVLTRDAGMRTGRS